MNAEVAAKLELIRQVLVTAKFDGVRFKGVDWFAWVTAGASNAVLLTAEIGVAEVLITAADAWVLTDEIEAQRLQDEELPANFQLHVNPWADGTGREAFVREATNGGIVCSDRPTNTETPLPESLVNYKRLLMQGEIERYRQVGSKASAAMTEVLSHAKPTWIEYQLAGAGAEALWARGLHPALTLVAKEKRLPLYRHATPSNETISQVAMMVFCARDYGLYANLTRFVCFGGNEYSPLHQHVREIETQALDSCKPGVPLNAVYHQLKQAYEQHGYLQAIYQHHQGGTCGYLAREIVANPSTTDTLTANMAMAWNPSLPGAKIEDTFVLLEDGKLENLTFEPNFPSVEIAGRMRPVPLEIT